MLQPTIMLPQKSPYRRFSLKFPKNENSLIISIKNLPIGEFFSQSEKCLSRREIFLCVLINQAVSILEAFSRPSIFTASSLILNFRILPAAFMGKESTKAT